MFYKIYVFMHPTRKAQKHAELDQSRANMLLLAFHLS